ncbi:MAG: Hpt domain-containing protein, partial [Blautia sp.]|nr:Hpt domain-containing protein [Blautia sp.]
EKLKEYGADTEQGLGRCVNNESFYLRMVNMGLNDANFDKLKNAVNSGDVKEAFEAAHALKGVIGNLALTPIYTPLSKLTELLRGKDEMSDANDLLAQVMEQLEKARMLND